MNRIRAAAAPRVSSAGRVRISLDKIGNYSLPGEGLEYWRLPAVMLRKRRTERRSHLPRSMKLYSIIS